MIARLVEIRLLRVEADITLVPADLGLSPTVGPSTRVVARSESTDGTGDLTGAVEDAQLYLQLGWRLANAPEMPRWVPGDEFEAARKRALEAVAR